MTGKRKIIRIDEEKCNGCGACIPNCPEGALQIIDGKVRLISDLFCDGLGACMGHCPQDAIAIEEREAQAYDECRVMANVIKGGPNVIKAHLHHLKEHNQDEYYRQAVDFLKEKGLKFDTGHVAPHHGPAGGCPGARIMDFRTHGGVSSSGTQETPVSSRSHLRQWPVQLMLVPPDAPYLNNADVLVAADCVPYAYAAFHDDLLKGKALLVGCPKLDDTGVYREKIVRMLQVNNIRSITYAHMEVPCCFGLVGVIQEAIAQAGKAVPFHDVTIGIQGGKIVQA